MFYNTYTIYTFLRICGVLKKIIYSTDQDTFIYKRINQLGEGKLSSGFREQMRSNELKKAKNK